MAKRYPEGSQEKETEITRDIACNLPGFEKVHIVFNLMATPAQVNDFVSKMVSDGSQVGIVLEVTNWPGEEYGPDPFDAKRVPGVWLAWLARRGWGKAMREYLDDPNSLTA